MNLAGAEICENHLNRLNESNFLQVLTRNIVCSDEINLSNVDDTS
jgi:hypothetical protein